MKVRMEPLVIIVLTVSVALAQDKADSSRLLALEQDWNTAYRQGNISKMNTLLADDYVITIEDGRTFSKSRYIALNGNSTARVEVSEMSDLRVRAYRNKTVVITGAYHEKGISQGKQYEYHDRFTDIWMNIGGHWQVIASHYSVPVKD